MLMLRIVVLQLTKEFCCKGVGRMKMTRLQLQALQIITLLILMGECGRGHDVHAQNLISTPQGLCFKTLYQFGASLFDTGNAVLAFPRQAFQPTKRPYGSTFPGYPARRFSDGKLIIDYLAEAFKVPHLRPYLGMNMSSTTLPMSKNSREYGGNGVCFSVALATALSVSQLEEMGIYRPADAKMRLNPLTLDVQYDWFLSFRSRLLTNNKMKSAKDAAFSTALYLPGEFGVNDYRVGVLSGLNATHLKRIVPAVVAKITNVIHKLHRLGGRNFLVIGVPPQGCSPFYLTMLEGAKDAHGCLRELNRLHRHHQSMLKTALQKLRLALADSNIIFADYYGAYMSVLRNPSKYGIKVTNVACCGGGGDYNYHPDSVCGTSASTKCSNPRKYVYWDDFHSTDSFNKIIAHKFLSGEFLDPPHTKFGCP